SGGDSESVARNLVDVAHLFKVFAFRSLAFVDRLGHRVERSLQSSDLFRRDLLHARGKIARLDPLRRGRQIAERYGDLARGAIGEEGDDTHEGETKKDQNADQRPLRLLDARGRHENGEKAGVLALRADDTEDSV